MIRLWLDDILDPEKQGFVHATWVKSAYAAIAALKTGEVVYASLSADMGFDVVVWMEENNVWPRSGVDVHTKDPRLKARFLALINPHYKFCSRG